MGKPSRQLSVENVARAGSSASIQSKGPSPPRLTKSDTTPKPPPILSAFRLVPCSTYSLRASSLLRHSLPLDLLWHLAYRPYTISTGGPLLNDICALNLREFISPTSGSCIHPAHTLAQADSTYTMDRTHHPKPKMRANRMKSLPPLPCARQGDDIERLRRARKHHSPKVIQDETTKWAQVCTIDPVHSGVIHIPAPRT
jgi:hypothetical protein